ncbi:MAG: EAL domain-containing protein, partial [Bosea sp. (in: a-proteobacteria)]
MPMRDADAAPARAAINELTAEVGLLGDLIHQVATTLADHDEQLTRARPVPAQAAPPQPAPIPVVDPEAARRARQEALIAEREEAAREAGRQAENERAGIISLALSEGRVEVHLQPIVELPQRRTRGYEALVRLRLDEATLLMPEQFIDIIEERGFGPTLDALVLTRTLAIARHLGAKAKAGADREPALFVSCNISRATWGSSRALATLARILDKYSEHAASLVVEIPQPVFRQLDPASLGLLGAMAATGVRFALDHVGDLRFDPASLFERGVRFVKAPAALLQAEMQGEISLDIAASDLATLLARASITLVAEEVADNPAVADMIELGVSYAQGFVFSPPRPVRPEVFAEPAQPSGMPEAQARPEPPTRASADVIGYPDAQAAKPQVEAPERLPFRAVLRRATA